jgi:hypothetical protein
MNITELIKKHLNKVVKEQQETHISEDGTYMVLSNLIKIKNDIETILSFKHQTDFPKLVTGEHAWAGDHITTSKDDIEEVANFIDGYFEQKNLSEAEKKSNKLCSRGMSAAKSKFKVYPSAYANGYAVQVCKGKIKGLDGKKHCSGSYCSGKK